LTASSRGCEISYDIVDLLLGAATALSPWRQHWRLQNAKPQSHPGACQGTGRVAPVGWVTLHGLMKELSWDWNEQRRGFRLAAVKTTVSASATESPRFPSGRAEILLAGHGRPQRGLQTEPKFEFSSLHEAVQFELSRSAGCSPMSTAQRGIRPTWGSEFFGLPVCTTKARRVTFRGI
jgi:hypothetical protein